MLKNVSISYLAVLHGGFLCMDRPVSIDVELISFITGLPSNGEEALHSTWMIKQRRRRSWRK
jgi:hypothetical protein